MTDELKAERQAFEKWLKDQAWFTATNGLEKNFDGYADAFINSKWIVWQARAKLDRTHTTGGDGDE